MKLFATLLILAWLPFAGFAQGGDINILKKHDTSAYNVSRWTESILAKISLLKQNIAAAKTDKDKLSFIFLLCDKNESLNNDTLYKYTAEAKSIALKMHDQAGAIRANYFLTICEASKGELQQAI